MTFRRSANYLLLLLLAVGVTSCAPRTRLVTNWALPGGGGGRFAKLAVIGIMKDAKESKAFETAVTQQFTADGVPAVPGFTFMEGAPDMSKQQMEKRVDGTGADGLLIFKVIAVDKSEHYVPPTAYITPEEDPYDAWWSGDYWGYYNPYPYDYWGYWYPAWQVVRTPEYWSQSKTYVVEGSLYRTSDHKLVWTGVTDTHDPSDPADLAASLSGTILKKLEKADLVAPS